MPGHNVKRLFFKDKEAFDRHVCVKCHLLLKDVVQPSCGHRLCMTCADEILANENPPLCPHDDCREPFVEEDGVHYFPDRFIRREIQALVLCCVFSEKGCDWEGKFSQLEAHLKDCSYAIMECELCGENMRADQLESHKAVCPNSLSACPLEKIGCTHKGPLPKAELEKHIASNQVEHLSLIADRIVSLETKVGSSSIPVHQTATSTARLQTDGDSTPDSSRRQSRDFVESDGPKATPASDYYPSAAVSSSLTEGKLNQSLESQLASIRTEFHTQLVDQLRVKSEEISSLRTSVNKLERQLRAKNAELEDRDFRISLLENGNHDGSMIWKIPQFSQRMSDAENGRYTSIFSLPFYTGRYGYKMCMRLYILGDGAGKGTHVSLFFVLMKGEFDNILQWPFTHKVTFKLINQAGGRDVVDTFQPDPMSSSFRKPRSDMNIASGCPKFVPLSELKNGGFIADDTVFIKCTVDLTTIKMP